jgi:hypothetical protein
MEGSFKKEKIIDAMNADSYPVLESLKQMEDAKVTFLDELLKNMHPGPEQPGARKALIRMFRRLETFGAGSFKPGRRGKRTRFVWMLTSHRVLAELAREETDTSPASPSVTHQFVVRPGYTIKFDLPADLTRSEAARIARFVEALSFEGPAERD